MNDLVEIFGWAFIVVAVVCVLAGAALVGAAWVLSVVLG